MRHSRIFPSGPFLLLLTVALSPMAMDAPALADGMFISPPGSFMYEPAQQALLEWDQDSGTETLTILPSFYGDATEFAWVVPVPGVPQMEMAHQQLFYALDYRTQAVYRSRDGEWDCFDSTRSYDYVAAGDGNQVNIVDMEMVGFYQAAVIQADDSAALLDSLTTWGYLHEDNREAVAESFASYVDRSWYFVAMQVDSASLAEYWQYKANEPQDKSLAPYYYPSWALEPVTFTFASEGPVYPMRISGYSAWDNTQVNLYVKADHRMTFPEAQTMYANRLSQDEAVSWGREEALGGRFQAGDFLTKLNRSYMPADMVDDIEPTRAATDDEFRWIIYSGVPVTSVLLFGSPVAWVVYRQRRSLFNRRRKGAAPRG